MGRDARDPRRGRSDERSSTPARRSWGSRAGGRQLVALKIEAIEAERRAQEQMDALWHGARTAIAQALRGEGERTQLKQRADVLLRHAIKDAVLDLDIYDEYGLKPEDVWGRRRLSTHRVR